MFTAILFLGVLAEVIYQNSKRNKSTFIQELINSFGFSDDEETVETSSIKANTYKKVG